MQNITITLTQDQADAIYSLVNEECYKLSQDKDAYAFMHRIRAKLNRAKLNAAKSTDTLDNFFKNI